MIIREEVGNDIFLLPLESIEKSFYRDFQNLKSFIESCLSVYNQDSVYEIYHNIIKSIDEIDDYSFPLLIIKKSDLIFIKGVLESMISDKVNEKLGVPNNKESILQGIKFIDSLIIG